MSAPLVLRGTSVRLRSIAAADRDALVAIRSADEVRRRWHGDDLVAEFDEDLVDDEVVRLTIEDSSGRIVGMIQYHEEVDPQYRHVGIDVYIDPAMHRRGYASDAIRAVVEHVFIDRGHHRLTIDPAADNAAAIAVYAKVGFRPVGRMRQYELQADGTWADGLLMELLADDWPPPTR